MRPTILLLAFPLLLVSCGQESETNEGPATASVPHAPGSAEHESPAGETIALTPRFREGESAVFEHHEVSRQSQATSLHGVTRVIRELRRFRLETRSVDAEGGAVLRLTMERVASEVQDNGQTTFAFDSRTPGEDREAQAQARRLLSGLVADIRVAPGGTVVTMRANLTPDDLRSLPASVRGHLAENWFRAAIESLYRPFGERVEIPASGEIWEESVASGPPFPGDENQLITQSRVAETEGDEVTILAETALYSSGEPRPESYLRRARYVWSTASGRLEGFSETQQAVVEGMLAGVASAETVEREISFMRVNPDAPDTDNPAVDPSGG